MTKIWTQKSLSVPLVLVNGVTRTERSPIGLHFRTRAIRWYSVLLPLLILCEVTSSQSQNFDFLDPILGKRFFLLFPPPSATQHRMIERTWQLYARYERSGTTHYTTQQILISIAQCRTLMGGSGNFFWRPRYFEIFLQ